MCFKTPGMFPEKKILPICLQSLGDFVGNDPQEMHLRSILMYFKRAKSEGLSLNKVKLFVSYKQGFNRFDLLKVKYKYPKFFFPEM